MSRDCNDSEHLHGMQNSSNPILRWSIGPLSEVSHHTEVSEVCCLSWVHISDSSTLLVEPSPLQEGLCIISTSCINLEKLDEVSQSD